jgi:hypothetical protein
MQTTSGFQDLKHYLLELGSRFNRADAVVYSLDPYVPCIACDGREIVFKRRLGAI